MQPEELDLDNPEFQQVYDLIENTTASVFMTGKAGTGKSTFLRYITDHTRKKHVVLAPTGIAAVNVGGQTIHSFFHVPLQPLLPDDPEFSSRRLEKRMRYDKKLRKLIKQLELIVIDEISMVRADLIDFIDKILRHYTRRPFEPFGGKQLLMVGDIFQLEPVVTADSREILRRAYRNFHFFSAHVFAEAQLVPIELRKVYRQSDPIFIAMLDRVRAGQPSEADLNVINVRYRDPAEGESADDEFSMTIASRRNIVDSINSERLDALATPAITFEAKIMDDFPETSYPTERCLTLKEGAQVVFVRNDMERRWVNGTLGRVSFLTPDVVKVTLEDGNEYTIEPEAWANTVYTFDEKENTVKEEVKGTFTQYPVRLAWALTIHKSQGLTFSRLNIDVSRAFTSGQTYVALSRARSLDGITLSSRISRQDVFVSSDIVNFSRRFNDSGTINAAKAVATARRLYARASTEFDQGHFGSAYDSFAQAVDMHNELGDRRLRLVTLRKLHDLASARDEVTRLERRLEEKDAQLAALADEFVEMGLTTLNEGWESEAALANFNKALRISPGHYGALVGRGRALSAAGASDDALETLREASLLEPERYEAPYCMGAIFLSEHDVANAVSILEKALKLAPERPEIYNLLADAHEEAGDDRAAERLRRQALRLHHKKRKR